MQTMPGVADILKGVAEHLSREVLPQLPRDAAYHTRVAINAIRLVERELRQMPAAEAAEQERLYALLASSGGVPVGDWDAALSARIGAGVFDNDPAALAAHLWATTLDQLAIDQPRYGNYLDDGATRSGAEK